MSYDVKVSHRLKRIQGQLRAVLRMLDEEKDCKEVITQLSAIRAGVDRTIGIIAMENLLSCIQEEDRDNGRVNQVVQQAMDLVIKSR